MKRENAWRDARNRKRIRGAYLIAVPLAVVLSIGAFLLVLAFLLPAQQRQTSDVAAALAEPVAQRVLAEGRAQSAQAARDQLGAANRRLIAKGLPIVIPPPEDALSAVVQVQASRALVLADLAESEPLADALRNRYRGQNTFPASRQTDDPGVPIAPGDGVIEVLPVDPPSVAPRTTGDTRPRVDRAPLARPAPTGPGPRPAPPPPPDRDLLEPCVLGQVLC